MSEHKTALVTGGTRGIGAAISKYLQKHGYKVIANYHSRDEAAQAFKQETGVEIAKFDVAKYAEVEKNIAQLVATHGPIHVLVNNAGITKDGFLHKMSEDDWDLVIETNLKSAFNLCRAVVPLMREQDFGRIINISSINAQKGQFGQTNYCAAKAGLIGFTKALALEGARKNITANVICPGYIETEMTDAIPADVLTEIIKSIPAGRMGRPEEIGSLVAYLASEEAAYITGAIFSANGGQYLA
jgi:acetoacetyl-CoA reductase